MEKSSSIILFAVSLAVVIGLIVFLTGNSTQQNTTVNSSNQTILNSTNITEKSTISSSELATHNSKTDCWIAYNGSVYDLTSWLPRHPGSSGAIEPYCGTSSEFEQAFSNQHGKTQVNRLVKESEYKGEFA